MRRAKQHKKGYVSIIIPCRNEQIFIGRCIDSIIGNDYPKEFIEILVIDGMSDDGSRNIIKQYVENFSFITLIENPKRITSCALNLGIEYSQGEFVLWMSAHNTYEEKHISKCIKYLKKYNAEAVGGLIRTVPRRESLAGKSICMALSNRFGVGNSAHKTGAKELQWADTAFGTCYKRTVFDKVGVFNEKLVRGQDMEFSLRLKKAGIKTLLVPEIVSTYHARSDLASFWKQNWNNGMWAILPFLHTEVIPVTWRHLIPLAFVVSVMGCAVLSLVKNIFIWVLLAIVAIYCTANLSAAFQIAWSKRDIRYLITMPPVFAILHVGYGLGSVAGVIDIVFKPQFWKRLVGRGQEHQI